MQESFIFDVPRSNTWYCAIQSGAYTFGTTKLAPQMVVVLAWLVTREFDMHKKDAHFAKLLTLEHNFWQCVVHLPWFCDHLAEVVSKSMPKNGTRFRDARIAKVTKLPKLDFGRQIIRKTLLFWRVDFEKSHFQNYRFLIKSLYMSIGILSKNHWFLHFSSLVRWMRHTSEGRGSLDGGGELPRRRGWGARDLRWGSDFFFQISKT